MRPLLISHSDMSGGAARAAYRLHEAFREHGILSQMRVRVKLSDDNSVHGPSGYIEKASGVLRHNLGRALGHLQQSENTNFHSTSCVPSVWSRTINASDVDIVNLHWVAYETLSIKDIGRIRKPVVWTLHDMWPFCGTEHYASDDAHARWRTGYSRANRPESHSGLDLDRYQWQRKQHAWKKNMHIVSPSHWLADCAKKSTLFKDWPISVIPNVLNTDAYKPLESIFCRDALGLPHDKKILLFGAIDGGNDPRKGYDLLLESVQRLSQKVDPASLQIVIFGQDEPSQAGEFELPTRWMGHINDDSTLARLYSAADVTVVSSRQENLPQIGTEAQSCGCPVVAFDCTGLRDVLVHLETGYLAKAFEAESMAEGLQWILNDPEQHRKMRFAARNRALEKWSPEVVVPQYRELYSQMLNK